MAKRTTLRSKVNKRLHAGGDKGGKAKDIQTYKRTRGSDIKRKSTSEMAKAAPAANLNPAPPSVAAPMPAEDLVPAQPAAPVASVAAALALPTPATKPMRKPAKRKPSKTASARMKPKSASSVKRTKTIKSVAKPTKKKARAKR